MPDLLTFADTLPALEPGERAWLSAYRKQLVAKYPDLLVRLAVYGSKARGDATWESDLDVLVLVRGGDAKLHRELRWMGYRLGTKACMAGDIFDESIIVYNVDEWEAGKREGMPFQRAVEAEAVTVHA